MAATSAKRLTLRGRRTLMTAPAAMRTAPPSGDLVNAVLQYADVQVDMGGGRTLLRLSGRRMSDPVIAGPLGREAHRLADVAVVWDEADEEIFRVLDAAAGDHLQPVADVAPEPEEDRFELTPAALAYLAASQGCA
ncbi:MAG: hypothetical protein INR64_01295 [Caulobacteraceae bacterium]|nr:hypothetical protein [Caulobacter sp.]